MGVIMTTFSYSLVLLVHVDQMLRCFYNFILYTFSTNSGDVYGESLLKIQQKLLDIESEKLQVQKELFEK